MMTQRSLLNEQPARVTRRQYKHDLLVTFMANASTNKRAQAPATPKPKILRSLLSLFL